MMQDRGGACVRPGGVCADALSEEASHGIAWSWLKI
jgi:hypothetical protein